MYVYIYISMSVTLSAPGGGGGGGGKHMFKMAFYQLHGCRLCTSGARRIRDQDKSITSFYPGRLTTAPTRFYGLCSLCFSRDLTAGDGQYADRSRAIRT